jgi:hypothetical protein
MRPGGKAFPKGALHNSSCKKGESFLIFQRNDEDSRLQGVSVFPGERKEA